MIYKIKKIALFFVLLFCTSLNAKILSDSDFVTTWKTNNPGESNYNQITIPIDETLVYNYNVDWNNDGTFDEFGITESIIHTFAVEGTYTIRISGVFPRIYFTEDKRKIISIDQWGSQPWTTMAYALYGCSMIEGNATDTPDLSNVTDMSYMFFGADIFNQDINDWDTSNITNMQRTFSQTNFNKSLDNWDTSNVTNMYGMFFGSEYFNQDLNSWDTSSVTDMSAMFFAADSFNGEIGNWDTSSVTDMHYMFNEAINFNNPIDNWDTSSVTNMFSMFYRATSFNQSINSWDTSSVTDMHYMFGGATNFNQSINNWDTSNVIEMWNMFFYAESFNQSLDNWDTSNVINMSGMFSNASVFNGEIGNWDTSNVTNMSSMFRLTNAFNKDIGSWDITSVTSISTMFFGATAFNQDIGNWDTSNITNFAGMFAYTDSFNQDIGNWDTSNITSLYRMFVNANSFDQNLGTWNISNLEDADEMFLDVTLSTENYDALLIGWQNQPLKSYVVFHAGESIPDAGIPAKETLVYEFFWTITDGTGTIFDINDEFFSKLSIYPNPSKGIFNINLGENIDSPITYSIISTTGAIIIDNNQIASNSTSFILDLSNYTSGIYFIKFISNKKELIRKIVVE